METDNKWKYFHLRQMFVILNNAEDGRLQMTFDVVKNRELYLAVIDEGRLIANISGKNYLSNAYLGLRVFFDSVKRKVFSDNITFDHDALLRALFNLQMFFEEGLLFSKSVQNAWEDEFIAMMRARGSVL